MQTTLETRVGAFILAALAIFLYMGFKIGAFRLDRARYNAYTVYFKDISELSRKSDVKIAGVKVGWVEDVALTSAAHLQAQVKIMVLKEYSLYRDAYAIMRQEGMLGPKYIELIPGDPLLDPIEPGGALPGPGVSPASMDDLLHSAQNIANNVEAVTDSINGVVGGAQGQEQLQEIFNNLQLATERFASFSQALDQVLSRFDSTAIAIEDASLQAQDGFSNATSIAEKIDNGQGTVGKLINEDEVYRDIKYAANGIKHYFAKVDQMQIVFDVHTESMGRPAENYRYEDSKGFFDIRIHPNQDHFYVLQLASSQKGWRISYDHDRTYFDANGDELDQSAPTLPLEDKLKYAPRVQHNVYERNTVKLGLQFGKIYSNVAFRLGLFEGTAGCAVDIDLPLMNDRFRWVTTFEVYDPIGWNRLHDRRPHFKWLNRMFLFDSIYCTFGTDDFVSKRNANVFFGLGLRWGDDDIKYIMSNFSGAISSLTNTTPVVIGV